jgi:hypothetical protein
MNVYYLQISYDKFPKYLRAHPTLAIHLKFIIKIQLL